MIERTPVLMIVVVSALALSACGDGATASGGPGGARLASEEPIDAVPLPLDDNPLSAPAPVVVAATTEAKPAVVEEATTTETTAEPVTTPAALAPDPAAKPARVVVAPREPSRPVERPVERPAPPPVPEKEGDKPVLTF